MGTPGTRRLTTDSILRIAGTEVDAIHSFTKKIVRAWGVVITYREHLSPDQCFLHLRSPEMIPEDDLDLLCRLSGVQMWTYNVLH